MRWMSRILALVLVLALSLAADAGAHPEPNDVDGTARGHGRRYHARYRFQRATASAPGCAMWSPRHGLPNTGDNCVYVANADQTDGDADGVGDACDKDSDLDGRQDVSDNCPDVANAGQLDNDRDGTGDVCDPDDDDDGVFDAVDNCAFVYNYEQIDRDGDGRGAGCDADDTPDPGQPAPGEPADTKAPVVDLSVGRRLRFAAVQAGLVVGVRCSEACAVTAKLRIDRRSARRARLRANAAVAAGSAQVESAASTYAFVRFRRSARRKLWRMARMTGTLQVTAVDAPARSAADGPHPRRARP